MIKQNFKAITGNQAASESMRQINPDVVAAYPITPQTSIMETFAQFIADGRVDTELIRVESEHSSLSACVGSAASGARTITATSSVGLALMWEVLGVVSGLRLPIVMHIVNRALSAPINIHCDHSDVMGARDQGWIQLFCQNNQEVYDLSLIAQRLAEKAFLPVMVCQDGFTTSHGVEKTFILSDEQVKKFTGEFKPDRPLLDTNNPTTYGPLSLPDSFTQIKKQQSDAFNNIKKEYLTIAAELSELSGRQYKLFEEYKLQDADTAIILLSSTASTSKAVIDELRSQGKKVGLLRPIMYRPFPYDEIAKALSHVETIAILDRTISFGAKPPLYSDIQVSLKNKTKLQSYIFGLGGHDTRTDDIKKVFINLLEKKFLDEPQFLYEK